MAKNEKLSRNHIRIKANRRNEAECIPI